ncbi:hypothetical protein PMAYCL1PPCAC_14238, partial [Pristionchus mayeri]
ISCSRALEAAISDSADVSGETGVLLRRTLTDFGAFVTRLEEEAQNSTKEQLDKTLKSMSNFRVALDQTVNSIEKRVQWHSIAGDSEGVFTEIQCGVDDIKEEEIFDYDMVEPRDEPIDVPLSIPDNQSFGLDVFDDEIKMEDILNDDMVIISSKIFLAKFSIFQDFGMDLIGDEMPNKDEPLQEE